MIAQLQGPPEFPAGCRDTRPDTNHIAVRTFQQMIPFCLSHVQTVPFSIIYNVACWNTNLSNQTKAQGQILIGLEHRICKGSCRNSISSFPAATNKDGVRVIPCVLKIPFSQRTTLLAKKPTQNLDCFGGVDFSKRFSIYSGTTIYIYICTYTYACVCV